MTTLIVDWIGRYSLSVSIGGLLLLFAIAHLILHLWIRKRTPTDAGGGHESRRRRVLFHEGRRLIPPLAVLLWINGLRAVVLVVVGGLGPTSYTPRLLTAIAWGHALLSLAALWWLLSRLARVLNAALTIVAHRSQSTLDDRLLPELRRTSRRLLPLLSLILGGPLLTAASPAFSTIVQNVTSLLLIAALASIVLQVVNFGAETILRQHRLDVSDNLHARTIHTQVAGLKKVATAIVVLFTVASMLMVFDSVRQLGTSILASAGIAGVVLGFAAQRGLGSLLAGLQVTLTQPIRMDDAVVVEGEYGNVEEITLTYVVVRLWDQRRLIVPISLFIEKPFQNWTRHSTELVGTVTLRVDYKVSIDDLRSELTRVLQRSQLWDGRVNVVQVTEVHDQTVEVRALVSASNASRTFDLRCDVREQLISFLREHYPR